jgi:hypothetical protein
MNSQCPAVRSGELVADLDRWCPGDHLRRKRLVLVAVPTGVVTRIGPEVAPAGTIALICVPESTLKLAAVPLIETAVAPVKPDPATVTFVPTGPLGGLKELMSGAVDVLVVVVLVDTLKVAELVAAPDGVVTVMAPEVAPFGTVAVT